MPPFDDQVLLRRILLSILAIAAKAQQVPHDWRFALVTSPWSLKSRVLLAKARWLKKKKRIPVRIRRIITCELRQNFDRNIVSQNLGPPLLPMPTLLIEKKRIPDRPPTPPSTRGLGLRLKKERRKQKSSILN